MFLFSDYSPRDGYMTILLLKTRYIILSEKPWALTSVRYTSMRWRRRNEIIRYVANLICAETKIKIVMIGCFFRFVWYVAESRVASKSIGRASSLFSHHVLQCNKLFLQMMFWRKNSPALFLLCKYFNDTFC